MTVAAGGLAARLLAGGGLAMAAASVVGGVGFALTPASGSPGERFGAFGDPWVEPVAAIAGVLGGVLLGACAVWAAARLRLGMRPGVALAGSAVVAVGFGLAAKGGLWLFARADPPLPSSWNWIQVPFAVGLLGWAAWLAGALTAVRSARTDAARGDSHSCN